MSRECGCWSDHDCCGGSRQPHGCDCGCGSHPPTRRYQTKAERISELEAYLSELKTETQAVEEHLADLSR